MVFEVGAREAGDEHLRHVEYLHRHRLRVGQAEALDTHEARLGRDIEAVGQARARGRGGQLERPAAGGHAAPPHVVAEGGEGQRLGDLGLRDVGAAAVAPLQVAVADQLVEGGPEGEAGNAQLGGQLALGGNRLADQDGLDQVEHPVPRLLLFAHEWYSPPRRSMRGI